MKPRVFIVHRWVGSPREPWIQWLKRELEKHGCAVRALRMPHPDNPTIRDWVSTLKKAVGKPTSHTYFVGHSVGSQTILRYVESLPKGTEVGGAVFVAPG